MSTSLFISLRDTLKDNVKFYRQRTPVVHIYSDYDYLKLIKKGLQTLYVDAGYKTWDGDYSENLEDEENPVFILNRELSLTEQEYVLVAAEIAFWNQSLSDYNTILSYTTDSLSITGSGNIGKLITETIARLNSRLQELFYKLPKTVNTMTPISHISTLK